MSGTRGSVLIAALVCLMAAPAAFAETAKRGTYITVDESEVEVMPGGQNGAILFLNRCPGGCAVTGGGNSSINDRSSIVNGTVFLSEWNHGDEAWDQLVACVRGVFEPFNIVVTDQNPGTTNHHEVMVAGTDTEFGINALGVSPFTSQPIQNSLTFVFANLTGSIPDLCWAAAQEPAHSWTLDHEYLCEDPMTYLTSPCGNNKYAFQNVAVQCHDMNSNPISFCSWGGQMQNSHQMIMNLFGPGAGEGPEIEFVRPPDGATVGPGFPIEASVTDISKIDSVELYINNQLVTTLNAPPYVFNAPIEMTSGAADIEVRGVDVHGFESAESIDVTIDPDADPNGQPPAEEGGCGCSSQGGGGGNGLIALLLLAGYWLRRRYSLSTSDT